MVFSFGSTTPATTTPAPAATGGFSFGGSAATPNPAPAATAPAPSAFSFGAPATAAPTPATTSAFSAAAPSATPTAAPATGGPFGTPAPATSFGGGGLFGSTTPAPAPSTGLFGTPTPAPGFPQQQPQEQQHITPNMPFKNLPPNVQQLIDHTYNLHHQHNQTMSSVSTMTPSLLTDSDADKAAGVSESSSSFGSETMTSALSSPLTERAQNIQFKLSSLNEELESQMHQVYTSQEEAKLLYELAHEYAIYPAQNIAARRGIVLPSGMASTVGVGSASGPGATGAGAKTTATIGSDASTMSASETAAKLNKILMENASQVDRLEGMPSIYLWKVMKDIEQRMISMSQKLLRLKRELEKKAHHQDSSFELHRGIGPSSQSDELSLAILNQLETLKLVANTVVHMNTHMDALREEYKRKVAEDKFSKGSGMHLQPYYGTGAGTGFDPFEEADEREKLEQEKINFEARKRIIQASSNVPVMNPASTPFAPGVTTPGAPAPSSGLFGSTTPAPATDGLFGSATRAPATGGLFGSTTPAPTSGGLFGNKAPAPATGGLFGGNTPAPATGGLFGSTAPAVANPAPVAGGFSFGGGATPAPASAAGGFSFGGGGTTPVPAPASGGLFGAPAPVPGVAAGGGLFGGTPAAAPNPAPTPAAGGGSFGGAAPAPAPGLFGAASPAPVPSTSRSSSRRRAGRKR